MISIRIDTKKLDLLAKALGKNKWATEKGILKNAMGKSIKPMLEAAKKEVPIGQRSRLGYSKNGRRKDYDRGGATHRDLRATVRDNRESTGSEIVGLVGVAQGSDKVGWRSHFITQGTDHSRANDFLQKAYDDKIGEVEVKFGSEVLKVTERKLKRALA